MNERLAFLQTVTPFNTLPADVLEEIAENLEEIKYNRESFIYHEEVSKMRGIDIIVQGEYESFFYDSKKNKRLIEKHGPGNSYGGVSVLLNRKKSIRTVIAKKGTLVYMLHRKFFRQLCKTYDEFFHHFIAEFGKRMMNDEFAHFVKRPAAFEDSYISTDQLYTRKIESLEHREIISCLENTPIFEAAKMMENQKISCLFVKDTKGKVIGFITDITLRNNVIAARVSTDGPVDAIMDNPIVSIDSQAYLYEALLLMFRTKTRYLLIRKEGGYIGFISRNKLLSEHAQSPFIFIQSVKLALSVDELRNKWNKVPDIVAQLLGRGVNAEIVNQVITTVSDTIALKVIETVIEEIGRPPAKFVFMVLGSEGRKEQSLKTDQDNAIIYEDKANEHREEVREYFLKFAEIVSDRLNYIGISFCEGGFMAKNSKWTHSLSYWKRNYQSWMEEPVPETGMKFSTFFDCRYLYGEEKIITELKEFLDEELQKPMDKMFFLMAKNALQYEPPLTTFFKNIRTTNVAGHEVFDIKKAMTPIVDAVRVYALRNRIFAVNTGERMKALKDKGVFSEANFQELMQSYYFLMSIRLRNQANQIVKDKTAPTNLVDISTLTKIEQVTLKEIFKTIENLQSKVRIEFVSNLFG